MASQTGDATRKPIAFKKGEIQFFMRMEGGLGIKAHGDAAKRGFPTVDGIELAVYGWKTYEAAVYDVKKDSNTVWIPQMQAVGTTADDIHSHAVEQ